MYIISQKYPMAFYGLQQFITVAMVDISFILTAGTSENEKKTVKQQQGTDGVEGDRINRRLTIKMYHHAY